LITFLLNEDDDDDDDNDDVVDNGDDDDDQYCSLHLQKSAYTISNAEDDGGK